MLSIIEQVNSAVNGFIWGAPAIICIVGVGILLSVRLGFIQFRKFGYALKNTVGKIFQKKPEAEAGALTPFQAVCTALAGTVGTGNIAGVAGAIAIGGSGVVFWMIISACLGMCTKFAEVTLAVHFRERNKHGDWVGGPMYYIKNGLGKHWQWLAVVYSVLGVLTVFGTGNATQVNTITTAIDSAVGNYIPGVKEYGTLNLILGVIITILIAMILLGGIKRIGHVTEKLVPGMALLYIVLALGIVIINFRSFPTVFRSIIEGAFHPSAVTGGVVGTFMISLQKGFSRGIFSNEAGLGTGSIAHACADVEHPVHQGYWGIFEVFADTIIICTLTALAILCSGINVEYGVAAGANLTISGFTSTYGSWVSIFTAIALCCFAFSTILGWGLYGSRCIEYLFGEKAIKPFMVIYAFVAILGATVDLGLLWDVADTFNGMMVIPNLVALFLLSGTVVKLVKEKRD